MKLHELLRRKSDLKTKAKLIYDNMKGDTLSEDEQKEWDANIKEVEGLEKTISAARKLEQMDAESARFAPAMETGISPEEKEKAKITKRYSFTKALRSQLPNVGGLDGIEKEMHEEAVKEARGVGLSVDGLGLPSFFVEMPGSKRDLTVTTEGTDVVQTDKVGLIPALRPKLLVQQLGAQVLRNLQGNIDLPRHSGVATAAWEGENDSNAETTPTLDKVSLTPNRLGAFTDVSKQLLFQSSVDVDNLVKEDLEMSISIALDAAAIAGNGGNIDGILGTSGIGSAVGGTNGANPDHADIVDLETEVAVDNADMGNLAYLTTPGVRGYLKQTLLDSGSGLFIWPTAGKELNGYRSEVSTQVPSTLTKGTADSICHAIIFGNFREVILANWAGLDLLVNPYTKGKEALVEVIANSWWDMKVRHAQSFAAMLDALIS